MKARLWGVISATAFVAIVISGSASAVSPGPAPVLFTYTPSYASSGGSPYVGTHVVSGPGLNAIHGPHAFNLSSGHAIQNSSSASEKLNGNPIFQVWTGVTNLTFTCTTSCAAVGTPSVKVVWKLSWEASLYDSSCYPGTGYSEVTIALDGNVVDLSTTPHSSVGEGRLAIYHYEMTLAGSPIVKSKIDQTYTLSFPVSLTHRNIYRVTEYVQAETQAGGYGCGARSDAAIGGAAGSTIIESITVL